MKNKWRVYIKPFDYYGAYTDWIEVTDDVDFDAMGSIAQDLDNTEYDIGVYRNSNFKLTLRNEHGKYSDVGTAKTIFDYKRSNSLCKITWEIEEDGPYCGMAVCGEAYMSEEMTLFTGLLNDEGLSMDLDQQKVSFYVLGRESIFQKVVVPFGTVHNGDLLSTVIYNCLNQSEITALLTVSALNISLGLDQAIESITGLQNKTVQEGLNTLLLASNSVLRIDGDSVIVSPRTASATVQHTFYGQGSSAGPESIQNIKAIKNGLARVYNYLSWKNDSVVLAQDATSVTKYGVRKKEFDFDIFTTAGGAARQGILDTVLAEFKNPKQEFDLYTPLNYETLALKLLDRVAIDYPTVYYATETPLPIAGIAIAGQAIVPKAKWSFTLSTTDNFKIIGRSISVKDALMKFKLRAV